jgi:hypothetical protein
MGCMSSKPSLADNGLGENNTKMEAANGSANGGVHPYSTQYGYGGYQGGDMSWCGGGGDSGGGGGG